MKYPLEQLLTIKKKRLDQAIKVLADKKEILRKEELKLKKCEEERDASLQHKNEKLEQLRNELDNPTSIRKIEQMQTYLKIAKENYKKKEDKVIAQKKEVQNATKQVEIARLEMISKQKDLEKIEYQKKDWLVEQKRFEEHKLAQAQEEIGSVTHEMRRRQKKKEDS